MAKFVITEENNKAQSGSPASMQSLALCRMDGASVPSLCGLNTMLCFINAIIHTYSRFAVHFHYFLRCFGHGRIEPQRQIIIVIYSSKDEHFIRH